MMSSFPKIKYAESSSPGDPFELIFHHVRRPKVFEHTHDFTELFWVVEGRCSHLWRGSKAELAPNDFWLLDPSDLHGFEMIGEMDYKLVNLAFKTSSLRGLVRRHGLEGSPLWGSRPQGPRRLRLSYDGGVWLGNEFRALSRKPKSSLSLELFLLSLMDRLGSASPDPFASCPAWLRDACVAMSSPANFKEGPRRFETLCGRTLAHVSRVLRETTGRTPVEWVAEWRMKHAAELLSTGSGPVEEVASACGFSSMGRFYSLFAEWHGVPPVKYRKRSLGVFPSSPPTRHDRALSLREAP